MFEIRLYCKSTVNVWESDFTNITTSDSFRAIFPEKPKWPKTGLKRGIGDLCLLQQDILQRWGFKKFKVNCSDFSIKFSYLKFKKITNTSKTRTAFSATKWNNILIIILGNCKQQKYSKSCSFFFNINL